MPMASVGRSDGVQMADENDGPLASRQAKRAELRAARRQKHDERAARRHVKLATEPATAARTESGTGVANGGANSRAVQRRAENPCAGINSEQAARLANPSLSEDLARAGDVSLGDPLLCPVCAEPLCRSVELSACGHVFCEACLMHAALQAKAQTCPLCRSPWALSTLARCSDKDKSVAAAFPGMARWRASKAAAASAVLHASVRDLERRLELTRSGVLDEDYDEDEGEGEDDGEVAEALSARRLQRVLESALESLGRCRELDVAVLLLCSLALVAALGRGSSWWE